MRIRWWVIVVGVHTLACATSGGVRSGSEPERVTVVSSGLSELEVRTTADGTAAYNADAPIEQVWSVLPQVYEELGVELAVLDTVSMRIGNTRFTPRRIGGRRLSQYLRCGSSVTAAPNADTYRVTMSLITRLMDAGDGTTSVLTLVAASAKPRDVGGSVVNCGSTGRLEQRVSEMVNARLGG